MASINGTNGNDTLTGMAPDDTIRAGAGNDLLVVGGNTEAVLRDGVYVYPNTVTIYDGGEGFDFLVVNQRNVAFDHLASLISIEGVFFERLADEPPSTFIPRAQFGLSSDTARMLPSNLLLEGYGQLAIRLTDGDSFDASAYRFAAGADINLYFYTSTIGGTVIGSSGVDFFIGGEGHDNFFGGHGADGIGGGEGNDHLYGQAPTGGPDGADTIYGLAGSDYIQGNAGNDSLEGGTGSDRINGGADNDQINAGEGNDSVNGNLGNDTISGGAGNDSLRGGQGNDSISGDDGDDVLSGDLGRDTLNGGAGHDSFVFSGQASLLGTPDTITDFNDQQDRIIIGYEPAAMLLGSAQANLSAAAILAQQLFDGHAGNQEAARIAVGSDVYLLYASDGGATVDSAILLQGDNNIMSTGQDEAAAS